MREKTAEIQEIIHNVRRMYQGLNEYSRNVVRETKLTGPQLWALKILSSTSPLRVSDLARHMYLCPSTVCGILDRLEIKGLVKRSRSKRDRRVVEVDLSEVGKDVAAKAPEVAQAMLIKGLEILPDQQLNNVLAGTQQIVRILGADQLTPHPLHG